MADRRLALINPGAVDQLALVAVLDRRARWRGRGRRVAPDLLVPRTLALSDVELAWWQIKPCEWLCAIMHCHRRTLAVLITTAPPEKLLSSSQPIRYAAALSRAIRPMWPFLEMEQQESTHTSTTHTSPHSN